MTNSRIINSVIKSVDSVINDVGEVPLMQMFRQWKTCYYIEYWANILLCWDHLQTLLYNFNGRVLNAAHSYYYYYYY